jgi:hypothetical protein
MAAVDRTLRSFLPPSLYKSREAFVNPFDLSLSQEETQKTEKHIARNHYSMTHTREKRMIGLAVAIPNYHAINDLDRRMGNLEIITNYTQDTIASLIRQLDDDATRFDKYMDLTASQTLNGRTETTMNTLYDEIMLAMNPFTAVPEQKDSIFLTQSAKASLEFALITSGINAKQGLKTATYDLVYINDTILIRYKILLKRPARYAIFKVIPVPIFTTNTAIIPDTKTTYIAISRRHYTFLSEQEHITCTTHTDLPCNPSSPLTPRSTLSCISNTFYGLPDPQCVYELFNSSTPFTYLHDATIYYSLPTPLTANLKCPLQSPSWQTKVSLSGRGKYTLPLGCTITTPDHRVYAHTHHINMVFSLPDIKPTNYQPMIIPSLNMTKHYNVRIKHNISPFNYSTLDDIVYPTNYHMDLEDIAEGFTDFVNSVNPLTLIFGTFNTAMSIIFFGCFTVATILLLYFGCKCIGTCFKNPCVPEQARIPQYAHPPYH